MKELCTKHCLVMEYLRGDKLITALMKNLSALAKERGQSLDDFIAEQKRLDVRPTAEEMRRIKRQFWWRDWLWNALGFAVNNTYGRMFALLGAPNGKCIVPHKETVVPMNMAYILDLVASVHGYELFMDGAFNGDPHPGNILVLDDGRLGLIDYGQVKHLDLDKRIELAKLLVYIKRDDSAMIVKQVEALGLRTQKMDPWVFEKTGRFYFDSDSMEVTEGMNMLLFMEHLNERDPPLNKADDYVFPGRLKMLISGLHWSLGYEFRASESWNRWCQQLLDDNGVVI